MGKREKARRVRGHLLLLLLLAALALTLVLAGSASALPTFNTPATPSPGTVVGPCDSCHTLTQVHNLSQHTTGSPSVMSSCANCHPNGDTSQIPTPKKCAVCHGGKNTIVAAHVAVPAPGAGCTICHQAPPAGATITSLTPNHGAAGASVTIAGTGFGATQGAGLVRFGTTPATVVTSWSDTSIVAKVPSGLAQGQVQVTVTPDGGTASAPMAFAIDLQVTNIKVVLGGVKNGVIKVNKTVTVKGTVTPARAGKASIVFQRKAGGKWVKMKAVTKSINATSGAFSVKYKVTKKGSWRVVCAVSKTTTATADQVRKAFKVK